MFGFINMAANKVQITYDPIVTTLGLFIQTGLIIVYVNVLWVKNVQYRIVKDKQRNFAFLFSFTADYH